MAGRSDIKRRDRLESPADEARSSARRLRRPAWWFELKYDGWRSVLYAQHIAERGCELFAAVCAHDLEGIVAKHRESMYCPDEPQQWIKVKNVDQSQAVDRH